MNGSIEAAIEKAGFKVESIPPVTFEALKAAAESTKRAALAFAALGAVFANTSPALLQRLEIEERAGRGSHVHFVW